MNHSFLDQYSDRDSPVHRLDPRTKFLSALLFILATSVTPPGKWAVLGVYSALIAVPLLLSRVPVTYVLKRSLVIAPFVVVVAAFIPFLRPGEAGGSYNVWLWQVPASGLVVTGNIVARAWLSVLGLVVLSATTTVPDLLKGLQSMRLPRVMTMLLSFMYRYIFVLVDEAMRMKQARDSRSAGGGRLWHIRTIGHMAGTLFLRSYERGERVYAAMLSRGFDGQSRTLSRMELRAADILCGSGFGVAVVAVAWLAYA